MRIRDVVGLALVALWQRKVRSLLTTVGVAVGSFVLLTSLSIGQGVQGVILGQLRKQDQLRRIVVWPGSGVRKEIPASERDVTGAMTPQRRERLRLAIERRWEAPSRKPSLGLTADQVRTLSRLEHVEVVTPAVTWHGIVSFGGVTRTGMVRTAASDDPGLSRRIVAGRIFEPGERAMLVSEYLVYRWGMRDEDEVHGILGETVPLELTQTQPGLGSLLYLLNVSRPDLTDEEQKVLTRVMLELPRALAKLDLSAHEQKVLTGILRQSRPEGRRTVARRLPVVGVFRDVSRAELGPFDGPPRPVDVVLSPLTAEEMFAATPGRAQTGWPQVSVRVDDEENLRGVEEAIKALGMETFSLADLLDQIRMNVLLIGTACTLVAVIALVVAALGITNTMLMSVLERRQEIGVMKAIGARDGQVMGTFLMEGTLIGVVGAVVGLLTAWLVSFPGDRFARHLVATRTPMRLDESVFAFPAWLVLGVPLLVCLLTTLAAVYPARRAARVDPIEALRLG